MRYVLLVLSLALAAPAMAAPIVVEMHGTITEIDQPLAADVSPSLANPGDAATVTFSYDPALAGGPFDLGTSIKIFTGTMLSMQANLNGGALQVSFDPTAGTFHNNLWLSLDSESFFNGTDFDASDSSGALQSTTIPTSSDVAWAPLQFVLFLAGIVDNTVVPTAPDFEYIRLDWRGSSSQSGIYVQFDRVVFLSDEPAGSIPEPGGAASLCLAAFVLAFAQWRPCRGSKHA